MIKISKELAEKIIGYHKLSDYLEVVVDYKGEDDLIKMRAEIEEDFKNLSTELGEHDKYRIINTFVADDEPGERFVYSQDEIIEELFPTGSKKNELIQSAYNWIPYNERIDWILCNVLCDKKHYDKVEKVTIDYLMTWEEISTLK